MPHFPRRQLLKRGSLALLGAGALASVETVRGQKNPAKPAAPSAKTDDCGCTLAADGTPLDTGTSELRPVIERYSVELRDYERIYQQGNMPVEMVRLAINRQKVDRNYEPAWKFYGEVS
jgi:hypothetical protein